MIAKNLPADCAPIAVNWYGGKHNCTIEWWNNLFWAHLIIDFDAFFAHASIEKQVKNPVTILLL